MPKPSQFCILFLISTEGYFGAENMLVTLATALQRQDCRCIIAVFRDSRCPHLEIADRAHERGLEVAIVPCCGRFDWRAVTRIKELVAKYGVDILHPHGYKADCYAYAAAWPRRLPIVATCHNWPNPLRSMRAYARIDRWVMRNFDRIVVVSDLVGDVLLRSGVRVDKIRYISNGIDCERFQSAKPTLDHSAVSEAKAVVGFVGRFVPEKGGAFLLQAAQKVVRMHPGTRFVLVGDGPCRGEWERLAVQLGIDDDVIFTGAREDMPGIYASLDIFVLPSLCEAMPMCVLEAMAAGKPVIASRVGAIPKLIIEQHSGMIVDPGNVEALARAIDRLLADPEQSHCLGANGSARASQQFSSEAMARQYRQLYREIIELRESTGKSALALTDDTIAESQSVTTLRDNCPT